MGKSAPQPQYTSANESMDSVMKAYIANLPEMMRVTGENIAPYEQAQLDAETKMMPQYTAAQLQLLKDYGSQFADINSLLESRYANQQAQSYADLFRGAGLQEAKAAEDMQRAIDPEWYASRELASAKLADLLKNPYTGSSQAETERGLNRGFTAQGLDGTPTSTSALSSAMQFGSAGRSALSAAISQAAQIMPLLRSGLDPFVEITGKPSSTNTQGMLGYTQPDIGKTTQSLGGNMLNNFSGITNNTNSSNASMYGNWVNKYQSAKDTLTGYYQTFGPQQFSGLL